VGLGTTIPAARACAEKAADLISWDGMQRRHDIAAALPGVSAGREAAATSPRPITAADWEGFATEPTAPQAPTRSPSAAATSTSRKGDH